ncbi:MAG: AAA family ATPase [Armatimonadetes bacterium]|nr:AAA family ATPase [Armatimonadota bacterium]
MSTSPGKIILVDGPSSSGKSTLAKALQDALTEPFWHYSIDHIFAAGCLPMSRMRSGEFEWSQMREAFFDGFHRTLPALADAGNNLIVEHIIETREWMVRLLGLLGHFDVFTVGLRCTLPELERREAARGDRPAGDAKRDFETLQGLCLYDLEVDSTQPLNENVERVIQSWAGRQSPCAFERMRHSPKS